MLRWGFVGESIQDEDMYTKIVPSLTRASHLWNIPCISTEVYFNKDGIRYQGNSKSIMIRLLVSAPPVAIKLWKPKS